MAIRFLIAAVCAFVGASTLAAAAAAPTPSTRPDFSTPAAALATFTRALEDGDTATLSAAMTGNAAAQEWALAMAQQVHSFRELEQALAKKFGREYTKADTGKEIQEQLDGEKDDDLHADLKRAKLGKARADSVVIELDEATPDDHQGRLLLVDGVWKVDVESFADYFSADDAPRLKAKGQAAAELARDVAAGKFATLDDAGTAIDERMMAAEDSIEKKPVAEAKPDSKPQPKPAANPGTIKSK